MKKIILMMSILIMMTSCSLMDPNGLSYNPSSAPGCFEYYDCSYIPNSMNTKDYFIAYR